MASKLRLLLAEDDVDIRDLISIQLRAIGFEVLAASTGAEALASLPTFKPHAMVLDINMPEVDGFAVLESLQRQGRTLPVLVMTARNFANDVQRAMALGATDYLTKPFTDAQLRAHLARLVRQIAKRANSLAA